MRTAAHLLAAGAATLALSTMAVAQGTRADRAGISPTVEREVRDFLRSHDRLLCEGKFGQLEDYYSPDFMSTDLGANSRAQMLGQWQKLYSNYENISLQTMVLRMQRAAGGYLAVSACRPFRAVDRKGREQVLDDFCETLILRLDQDGRPRMVQLFDMDHDKLEGLQTDRRYVSESLAFHLEYPESLLVVPHRTPGTQLEKLVFLDPARAVRIDVSLLEPTLPVDLKHSLQLDLMSDARCRFTEEPAAVDVAGFRAAAGEVEYCAERFGGELDQSFRTRALYLTPDGRMLFAMLLKAPADGFTASRGLLDQLARGLALDGVEDPRDYADHLFALHPNWSTVEAGFYEHPTAPLSMEVPEGLRGVALAGDPMQRLRLDLKGDPDSYLLLQVYEPEWMDDAAEKRMYNAAQWLLGTACCSKDRKISSDVRPREFLGQHCKGLTTTIHCPERDRTLTHRVISTERDGFYVQLLLVAGSDRVELQRDAFERTVGALVWD